MAPLLRRIVIADDSRVVGDILAQSLSTVYPTATMLVTTDGQAALQLYETGGADLLILDVMMPGLSGTALVRTLRARGDTVPILLISAVRDFRDANGHDVNTSFCAKPFETMQLLDMVAQLLSPD